MAWHLTGDPDEFWSAASKFLRSRPVEHSLPLTLTDTLRTRDLHHYGPEDPLFGWCESAGEVVGACLQTPPHPLLIVGDASAELATTLAGRPLSAINTVAGDAFAGAWQQLTGTTASVTRQTRLFRLGTFTPPSPPPPGRPRVAQAADRELLVGWLTAFHKELGEHPGNPARTVEDKLSYGGLTVWEVDGDPVSLAGATRPEDGVVRVAPVFTPAEQRGHGYAAGATAAVTQAALDAGANDVVLFTDVANPTSNALYQRLGYRPIEDRVVMEFSA